MNDQEREVSAKRLLNDPLFAEAFEVLRKDLMDRWDNSGTNELEAREAGHMNKVLEKQHPFI